MPLDPQVEELLQELAQSEQTPLEHLRPEQARRQMEAASALLGEGEPVALVRDVPAPGPAGEIPLRLYYPQASAQYQPAIVYFHGGGWVIGSIETHDAFCRSLANASKCVVASVEYRLAPEHRFPAAIDDCYAATRWLSQAAMEYGLDPGRIAVAGDSAGGNLSAAVSLRARDEGLARIAAQVLIYPIVDCDFETASYRENSEGYLLTSSAMRWFWENYLSSESDKQHPYAAPLAAPSLAALPRAMVLTAQYDPLRDEGHQYAQRLAAEGIEVQYTCYQGMIHGFIRRGNQIDKSREALHHIANWLGKTFGTQT